MEKQLTRIELARKPVKCPTCGARPIANILRGMPAFSEELEKEMEAGLIVLGGCCIDFDDPTWQCSKCGQEFHKKNVSK